MSRRLSPRSTRSAAIIADDGRHLVAVAGEATEDDDVGVARMTAEDEVMIGCARVRADLRVDERADGIRVMCACVILDVFHVGGTERAVDRLRSRDFATMMTAGLHAVGAVVRER